MQILINGSQKKTRLSRIRKIFSPKKAQIVIIGILKPQIQLSWTPPLDAEPEESPEKVLPEMAFMSDAGTANAQFGVAFFRKLRSAGSGSGTGDSDRPALSYQAAMRKGSENLLHTNSVGHSGACGFRRRKILSR